MTYTFLMQIIIPFLLIFLTLNICLYHRPLYMLWCLIIFTLGSSLISMIFVNIYFINITFIIIYIGAIMILFLFIIMMFNLRNEKTYMTELFEKFIPKYINLIIIFLILNKIYFLIKLNIINILYNNLYFTDFVIYQYNNIKFELLYYNKDIYIFSENLYTKFGSLLILIAIVMLIAMFGSLDLVLKKKNYHEKI